MVVNNDFVIGRDSRRRTPRQEHVLSLVDVKRARLPKGHTDFACGVAQSWHHGRSTSWSLEADHVMEPRCRTLGSRCRACHESCTGSILILFVVTQHTRSGALVRVRLLATGMVCSGFIRFCPTKRQIRRVHKNAFKPRAFGRDLPCIGWKDDPRHAEWVIGAACVSNKIWTAYREGKEGW